MYVVSVMGKNGKKELVLVGGGHAHMVTLARLREFTEKGFGVTLIQPSVYHYYSGMGPGMLGGTYSPEQIRFETQRVVEAAGGHFILDHVFRIDPYKRRVLLAESGKELPYDVLSLNSGSSVNDQLVRNQQNVSSVSSVFSAKPIERLVEAKARLLSLAASGCAEIAVVGGGASALEIAGNIQQLCGKADLHMPRITIYAGSSLLGGHAARMQKLARRLITKKGVHVLEGDRVKKIDSSRLTLSSDRQVHADLIFLCTGVKPSEIALRSGLPVGPDGGFLVNQYLRSPQHDTLFGGGDCIYFHKQPLDKVGVYAVRQNPVLFHNLLARLEGRSLKKFSPGGDYLQIFNLGDGVGIFSRWPLIISGRLPFIIKDWIDRRFIRSFSS